MLVFYYRSSELKGNIQIEKENKHSLKVFFEFVGIYGKILPSGSIFLPALLNKLVTCSLKLSMTCNNLLNQRTTHKYIK